MMLRQFPVPLPQEVGRKLGLPLSREDPLLVPRHPPSLLPESIDKSINK